MIVVYLRGNPVKLFKVIESCKTLEQLEAAKKYQNLFWKKYVCTKDVGNPFLVKLHNNNIFRLLDKANELITYKRFELGDYIDENQF